MSSLPSYLDSSNSATKTRPPQQSRQRRRGAHRPGRLGPPCRPALDTQPYPGPVRTANAASTPHAGSKENSAPVGAEHLGLALAAGVAAGGVGLLRLHSRSCELARQLSQTRSELESKSSQLSEVMEELQTTRCGALPVLAP